MRAIVLSAGYGTRLWPLTEDRTKPAIPILGKPLVGYVAEYLVRYGFDEIVVNLHHRPESVRKALGDGSRFGVKLARELAPRRNHNVAFGLAASYYPVTPEMPPQA